MFLYLNYFIIFNFDRSKWPASQTFHRSKPQLDRTLSVDRPLFSALNIETFMLKTHSTWDSNLTQSDLKYVIFVYTWCHYLLKSKTRQAWNVFILIKHKRGINSYLLTAFQLALSAVGNRHILNFKIIMAVWDIHLKIGMHLSKNIYLVIFVPLRSWSN